jgi:hypothetical protein
VDFEMSTRDVWKIAGVIVACCSAQLSQACEEAPAVWAETNNIRLGFTQSFSETTNLYIEVDFRVIIYNVGENNRATNGSAAHLWCPKASFFMATNSCWGLMELTDESGRKVEAVEPNLNTSNSYPYSFQATEMHWVLMSRFAWSRGPGLPQPVEMNKLQPLFPLHRYFRIQKEGNYSLVIWPKLYRRMRPGSEICKRIDFPPVTVPLRVRK